MSEQQSSTGPSAGPPGAPGDPVENLGTASARGDHIGVGSGDENVAKIQLAARWSEQYAPSSGDSLDEALRRFRRTYLYIESVTRLMEPEQP